jgi:integrase
MSPATANIRLRQLRAIWNHAARWHWPDTGRKWRIVKRPPPMQFFTEVETEVNAWTIAQLAAIEEQARKQVGHVGTSLANVFWTALHLLFSRIASRETATLLARREDYNPEARTIRLRAETQKQRQDQSFVLPQGVATAIDRLLASHDHPLIFGCWPYDPPVKSTGRRKWRVLENHWKKRLVFPAGLSLQKGVGLRQYRRSGATICDENGGNAQELLGHSSPKTTERHYKDRKRKRACRQSLFIPDASPQQLLF